MRNNHGWLLLLCSLLTACSTETNYAPVIDATAIEPIPKTGQHKVSSGETLYEIAWRYGLDYRSVAQHNQLAAPYKVNAGQNIQLAHKNKHLSIQEKKPVQKELLAKEPHYQINAWISPAKGMKLNTYALNKGLDIQGYTGAPIYAAAPGKVVYSGSGLRGYGNLIIIKHNSVYLSAYAYNRSNLVKEGDWVKQGQEIAEMGIKNTGKPMLHFEIRRAGKPVNPLNML